MTNRQINFILSALVLLIFFILGEFFLRLRYPATVTHPLKPNGWAIIPERIWIEYHPILGWFHQKNKKGILQKGALEIPLTTNSLGLRGSREYALEKPAGKFRVFAVGDSFTFGFGVRDEEVFTRQMELKNPTFEVFNLGVAGYGIDQINLLVREFGFSYHPDTVLLFIYPEDFWRATRAFNDAGYGKPYYRKMRDGGLHLMHSPVPREKNFAVPQFPIFIEPSIVERLFSWSYWYKIGKRAWSRIQKSLGAEDPDTSPEWILGRSILKETLALVRAQGLKPLLVTVPPQRWFLGTVEPINKSLARFAAREQIDFLDLVPVFQKAMYDHGHSIDFYYIPDDLHWTAAGHALVADTILEYLKQSKMSVDAHGKS